MILFEHESTHAQKGYDPAPLVKWNMDIGRAYSFIIADDKLIASGNETVTLLDIESGHTLWRHEVEVAGDLLFELLVSFLEPDEAKAEQMRSLLDQAELLGVRAQIHSGSFDEIPYAPYSSNCVIWGDRLSSPADKIDFTELYRTLRPWAASPMNTDMDFPLHHSCVD
jgi:hypothetical protein